MKVRSFDVPVVEHHDVYACDLCGNECKGSHLSKCVICGRDACKNCRVVYDGYWNDSDSGDYPDYCCKRCWDIGEPFREKYQSSNENHWNELESIISTWKNCVVKNDDGCKN